jgi:type IV pilus assembly protein PilB
MEQTSTWTGVATVPRRPGRLLGDVVVDLGLAEREDVEHAVAAARERGIPTGQVLVERKVLRQDQLAQALAERFGVDYIDLSAHELDMGVATLLSPEAIKRYQAIPVGIAEDGALMLAMADPANVLIADDVAMITGRRVRVLAASAEDLLQIASKLDGFSDSIADIAGEEQEQEEETQTLSEAVDADAPIIKLVHALIAQAVTQGASDVHITPQEGDTEVEFRVDGVLHRAATIRRRMTAGVISRIKIMADLDISERRVPQDGRLALTVDSSRVDIRVVTLPLVYGEGAVLRILDRGAVVRDLSSLGIEAGELQKLHAAIKRPHGTILVTGPTGSGKSTTLYAALGALAGGQRSVLTIEDPVESRIEGVKQIQVAPKAGVTFATGLRTMLRADPDVIMVGEIRDGETARIAVEAALTGHLVLSTLHTRDAPSALSRLLEMGVEPFLISAAIDCVVAQRLIRVLCPHCKQPMSLPPGTAERYGLQDAEVFEAVGCQRCANTGYRGRVGVYEIMALDEDLKAMVLERARAQEITALAERKGMRRMHADGLAKVRDGITSIAEVERVTTSVL